MAVLFLWAQLVFMASPPPALASGQPSPYKDVTATDPNLLFINYLKGTGIITGFPDGTYRPASSLTRGEAAVILVKAAGLKPAPEKSQFKDVGPNYWAAGSIAAAKKAGLLNGYPDGNFRPEARLTRAEGISLVLKLSKQADTGVALPTLSDINTKHWAARQAAIGLAANMVSLTSDNKRFLPDAPFTRGSMARSLALLLTEDPALYTTNLTNTLNVIKGTVTVTRSGSKTPETIKNSSELKLGDIVITGAASTAEIVFPDGTGLRLEEKAEFNLKESKGRSYIKADGSPGTAVEWLVTDLNHGKLYGALATNHETTGTQTTDSTKTASTIIRAAGLAGYSLVEKKGRVSIPATRITVAAAASAPLPWWQTSGAKRTKIKVDMPTGVAAIRGTFWENDVNETGGFTTNLLTGEAEVTANGQSVDLTGGQRTEVAQAGAPPVPPAPMTQEDKRGWVALQQWAQQRAEEIQIQQAPPPPPPPPAEQPQAPPPPTTTQPDPANQPAIPNITAVIDNALTSIESGTATQPETD